MSEKKQISKRTKVLVAVAAGVAAAAAVILDVEQSQVQPIVDAILSWFTLP